MLPRTKTILFTAASMAFACSAYAESSDATALYQAAPLAAPAKGRTVIDPTFGASIRRLTDRGEHGGLATAEYPQLQAFNADETRLLLTNEDGTREVIDFATGETTHAGITLVFPRWSPVDANAIIGFDHRSGTIHLQEVRLGAGGTWSTRDLVDVSALGYSTIEDGCFEEPSEDGRYITLIDVPNSKVSVLDITTGRLRSTVHPEADVDWVKVSDSGRYLLVQYVPLGVGPAAGLAVYDASNGRLLGHVADHHAHGDLAVDAAGNDLYVTMGYTDSCASGQTGCYSVAQLPDALELGARRDLYQMTPNLGSYTSCRNIRGPGYCLNGDDYAGSPGEAPFARELWLTRVSDGAVKRFAHHRSSACGYFTSARPSISRSGRWAIFTSDWARPNCDDQADLYAVDLQPLLGDWIPAPATPAQPSGTTASPATPARPTPTVRPPAPTAVSLRPVLCLLP